MISFLNSLPCGFCTGDAKCLLCGTQWIYIYQHFSEVKSTWGLWWEKWYWERIFSDYFPFALLISFHQFSIIIFIYVLRLSEGQTGQAWEPYKKQCCLGSRGTLDKVLSLPIYLAKETFTIENFLAEPPLTCSNVTLINKYVHVTIIITDMRLRYYLFAHMCKQNPF